MYKNQHDIGKNGKNIQLNQKNVYFLGAFRYIGEENKIIEKNIKKVKFIENEGILEQNPIILKY